ncbi:hypothetical protein B0H66DRAFT_607776 [Apodospora peruviana]|uniref:Uncharacterized protein n=1 Tax=Apodospora peruviana TaxID=516989 RepID=A0AAE0HTR1_9PEZI|nr:hypothetical protein B0H66DRAFT_607776 [Apodospora peruviana]
MPHSHLHVPRRLPVKIEKLHPHMGQLMGQGATDPDHHVRERIVHEPAASDPRALILLLPAAPREFRVSPRFGPGNVNGINIGANPDIRCPTTPLSNFTTRKTASRTTSVLPPMINIGQLRSPSRDMNQRQHAAAQRIAQEIHALIDCKTRFLVGCRPRPAPTLSLAMAAFDTFYHSSSTSAGGTRTLYKLQSSNADLNDLEPVGEVSSSEDDDDDDDAQQQQPPLLAGASGSGSGGGGGGGDVTVYLAFTVLFLNVTTVAAHVLLLLLVGRTCSSRAWSSPGQLPALAMRGAAAARDDGRRGGLKGVINWNGAFDEGDPEQRSSLDSSGAGRGG